MRKECRRVKMKQIPFSFKQLPIIKIIGPKLPHTRQFLFELNCDNSGKFILCNIPYNIDAETWLIQNGIVVGNIFGPSRDGLRHNSLPFPKLTREDYKNIIACINSTGYIINTTDYIYYAVDLESGIIRFDLVNASNIKEARQKARDILTKLTGEEILIKNLMLDPVKNSPITYTSNLHNSFIGECITGYNKYYTEYRYLFGVFKPTKSIYNSELITPWHY